jgi:DNA ligase 1
MADFGISTDGGDLRLGRPGLWLDAHQPRDGIVFVSHAHSDHLADHREVILSAPTAQLMQARIPGARREHVLAFGEHREFAGAGGGVFRIALTPAGHIFGSAMALVEFAGGRLLYTGDFKMRHGLSAERCEPLAADVLIMETTFGRPRYVFPPAEQVMEGVIRFCREALDNDETPVLLGYSLGKSQEILCGLGQAGLPLVLHGTVFKLTRIYEAFGRCFPPYEAYQPGTARGKVLLCPPNVVNSALLRNLGKVRTAVLTGWAVDPGCRYRYQCDAAFPLSDHADFPGLLELVEKVHPAKVYTTHGFAPEFAAHLRKLGYDAQALVGNEQLELSLASTPIAAKATPQPVHSGRSESENPVRLSAAPGNPASGFHLFALTADEVGAVAGKLEKVRILSAYLARLEEAAIEPVVTWFSGRPFPVTQAKVLQLGWSLLRDGLCAVAGLDADGFHQVYLKHSDLGQTARELLLDRPVRPSLGIQEIREAFERLQAARGPLSKRPILEQLLGRATPVEAKYIVKIITGDLRIGLREGLVEEAIAASFQAAAEEVRQANLLLGNPGATALLARRGRLHAASLVPLRPIKFMLASPEETAGDIWDRLYPDSGETGVTATRRGAWLEDKYDGIRCQAHKTGKTVALFSRDLKEITATFAELADAMASLADDFILDGEIVAMRGEEILPFASLQRRLGRKDNDLFMRDEIPVCYVAFDLLWMNGNTWLRRPLFERRQELERLLGTGGDKLRLARISPVCSAAEIDEVFRMSRARGNEGLMIKDPASLYSPGRRGLAWLKLKKALATLDCVVVGAEYGHGKRSRVLSDYTFAVREEKTGELKTIGKAYTGLTDVEIEQLTGHFLSTGLRQRGRYIEVKPDTVLEIAFDRIQHSTRHNSGLAMRFPRIIRIRTDKPVSEIDTLERALSLAAK